MDQSDPLLVARNVSKQFGGVTALDDVTLEVRPGEVHCVVGENGSGKSTLIKIISGVVTPDAGTITLDGRSFTHLTPRQAIALGIEVIFQDFSLFPNLTVAENIGLAAFIAEGRRTISAKALRKIATDATALIGVRLDFDARVEELSVADKQLTAICRALAQEARVIFMDEPTTALTWREVKALFSVVESLKQRDVALIFVSHKIEEILRISERITVLRNGVVAVTGDVADFDRASIVQAMTGRPISESGPPESLREERPVIDVRKLSLHGAFEDVSFSVRCGEIVGVTGLLGSGRTEIAESLFGITPADGGSVVVDGKEVRIRSVRDAMRAGIGYVPADRLTQGVFLDQTIGRNIIAGSLQRLVGRLNLLRRSAAAQMVSRAARELRIKMSSSEDPVSSLSGGNQQRVVLAKWLARDPRILILNSPTVGVDVASKQEILEMLRAKAKEAIGIIIISDDVPELVAVCHRVLVVRRGRIFDQLEGERLTEEAIVKELAA